MGFDHINIDYFLKPNTQVPHNQETPNITAPKYKNGVIIIIIVLGKLYANSNTQVVMTLLLCKMSQYVQSFAFNPR